MDPSSSSSGSKFLMPLLQGGIANYGRLSENDCVICLEPLIDKNKSEIHLRQRHCGHVFHKECLSMCKADGWRRISEIGFQTISNSCPACRADDGFQVNDFYVDCFDSMQNGEGVHIRIGGRGPIKHIDFFVNQNTNLKKIANICKVSCFDNNEYPVPYLKSYEPNFEYNISSNIDIDLCNFGVKNGDDIELHYIFKY